MSGEEETEKKPKRSVVASSILGALGSERHFPSFRSARSSGSKPSSGTGAVGEFFKNLGHSGGKSSGEGLEELRKTVESQQQRIEELVEEKKEHQLEIQRLSQQLADALQERIGDKDAQEEKTSNSKEMEAIEQIRELEQKWKIALADAEKIELEKNQLSKEFFALESEKNHIKEQLNKCEKIVEELQSKNDELQSHLENEIQMRSSIALELDSKEASMVMMSTELEQAEKKLTQCQTDLQSTKESLYAYGDAWDLNHAEHIERLKKAHQFELDEAQEKFISLTAERNQLSKKVESQKKELRNLMKSKHSHAYKNAFKDEYEDIEKENKRLKEELERKNTSLADALEALQIQMAETSDVQDHLKKELKDKELKSRDQLIAENKVLRSLANQLSEDLRDREVDISEIRQQYDFLLKRHKEMQQDLDLRSSVLSSDGEKTEQL